MINIEGTQISEEAFAILAAKQGFVLDTVKPKGRWRAKNGSRYKMLSSNGSVALLCDAYCAYDNYRYATGNYYHLDTPDEEILKVGERLKAKQRIIDYYRANEAEAVDWKNIGQAKYYAYHNHKAGVVRAGDISYAQVVETELYTTNEAAAKHVRDNMLDDLKLYLGGEE